MGYKKSIRPTRTIFQGGLHMAGACRLPPPWNGCEKGTDFCFKGDGPQARHTIDANGTIHTFHLNHYFDEQVTESDIKLVDAQSEGVLNHLQYRRLFNGASAGARAAKGEYATSHFSKVYEALERRGLAMAIELPPGNPRPFSSPDHEWMVLLKLHEKIDSAMKQALNGKSISLDPSSLGSPLSKINLNDILPVADRIKTSASLTDGASGVSSVNDSNALDEAELDYLSYYPQDSAPEFQSLPAFSDDMSELFLAAMIEREDDSWDLHLTSFMISHIMIEPDETGGRAHNVRNDKETLTVWSRAIVAFKKAEYLPSGMRAGPKFSCKISHASGEAAYTVEGKSQCKCLFFLLFISFSTPVWCGACHSTISWPH